MWIIKIFKKADNKKFYQKFILDMIVFVFPIVIIFVPYLFINYKSIIEYDTITVVSLLSAFSWSVIGPLLINNYFYRINQFVDCIDKTENNKNDIIPDKEDSLTARKIYEQINTSFKKINLFVFVVWDGLLLSVLMWNSVRMEDFNFFGFSDPYFWILLIYISFVAYLQSIGFTELIICNKLINRVINRKKFIENIIESDFENGIRVFGSIITTTTLSFFSGILYFPILIIFCKNQSAWIYASIIIVMFIFLFSLVSYFLLSSFRIWKCAQARKKSMIDEFQSIYNDRMYVSINNKTKSKIDIIVNEMKIHNINEHIKRLETIRVNPLLAGKSITVVLTIVFPALFFMKDFIEVIQMIYSLL